MFHFYSTKKGKNLFLLHLKILDMISLKRQKQKLTFFRLYPDPVPLFHETNQPSELPLPQNSRHDFPLMPKTKV